MSPSLTRHVDLHRPVTSLHTHPSRHSTLTRHVTPHSPVKSLHTHPSRHSTLTRHAPPKLHKIPSIPTLYLLTERPVTDPFLCAKVCHLSSRCALSPSLQRPIPSDLPSLASTIAPPCPSTPVDHSLPFPTAPSANRCQMVATLSPDAQILAILLSDTHQGHLDRQSARPPER